MNATVRRCAILNQSWRRETDRSQLTWLQSVSLAILGASLFELAYLFPILALPCMIGFGTVVGLLNRYASPRQGFYLGLAMGTVFGALELNFLARIFGSSAVLLWLVLGIWLATYFLIANRMASVFPHYFLVLGPVLWMGIEYTRSELYYLRFSWVTPGLALADSPFQDLLLIGQYATSALLIGLGILATQHPKPAIALAACVFAISSCGQLKRSTPDRDFQTTVAGIQLEYPSEHVIPHELDRLIAECPQAQLLVLSEYTVAGSVPTSIRRWCDANDRYLVLGGKDPTSDNQFFNTAFVVGPMGTIVHQQAKSVPIQFFRDGLPAESQDIWESPWGRVAVPTCYDLSYTRVMDRFVDQDVQLIINPTMDPQSWGRAEHFTHARIPVCRSIEYGTPIFRVASSGISRCVDSQGCTVAMGDFPGQRQIVSATIQLAKATLPIDRWLSPCAVAVSILLTGLAFGSGVPALSCLHRRQAD